MREIKYRAWDKRFKKMDFGGGDLLLRINEKDFTEPMQYTGLKDKNGVEIYEGDIVVGKMCCMDGDYLKAKYPACIRYYLEVYYSDGKGIDVGFTLKRIKPHPEDAEYLIKQDYRSYQYSLEEARECHLNKDNTIPWLGKNTSIEVIGNIHQNPELIKQHAV